MKKPMKDIPTLGAERFAALKAKVEAFRKAKAEEEARECSHDGDQAEKANGSPGRSGLSPPRHR